MILTGSQARVVQLHPTRRCNLECLHCYSMSGPSLRAELPLEVLAPLIDDAAAEGYNVVSVSGGEPLLYRALPELLDAAAAAGMATTVVSNGTVLTEARVERLVGRVGLLVVSVDGAPATHDRMRGRAGAFALLEAGLEHVVAAGLPFGVIFTMSRDSAPELPWVARFAAERGASVLQIHALEEAGRAVLRLAGAAPGPAVNAATWVAAAHLRRVYAGRMTVHVDIVDRADLAAVEPRRPADVVDAPLASLVSPLVVEADGVVVPLQYGFPRRHALGSVLLARLRDLVPRWRAEEFLDFQAACGRAFAQLRQPVELPFVSLYQELTRRV